MHGLMPGVSVKQFQRNNKSIITNMVFTKLKQNRISVLIASDGSDHIKVFINFLVMVCVFNRG